MLLRGNGRADRNVNYDAQRRKPLIQYGRHLKWIGNFSWKTGM